MLASTTHQSKRPDTSSYKTKMVEAAASSLRRGWQSSFWLTGDQRHSRPCKLTPPLLYLRRQIRLDCLFSSQYWGPLISLIPQRISACRRKKDKGTLFMEVALKLNILNIFQTIWNVFRSFRLPGKKEMLKLKKKPCRNTEQYSSWLRDSWPLRSW